MRVTRDPRRGATSARNRRLSLAMAGPLAMLVIGIGLALAHRTPDETPTAVLASPPEPTAGAPIPSAPPLPSADVMATVSPASGAASAVPSAPSVSPSTTPPAERTPAAAVPTDPSTPAPVATSTMPPPTAAASTTAPNPGLPVDATLDAAIARCPTAAEIAFVDSRISLTFVDDLTAPTLVCRAGDGSADLTRLQERAYQAVLAMKRIPFDEPLPWTDRTMFGWFTHAVTGVEFRDSEFSYCCERDRVIVIRSSSDMAYLADDHWAARTEPHFLGLMGLPGLMAHEARHAEGYDHTCGFNDDTFEEMGAWAIHYLYYVWLGEHAQSDYMMPVDAPSDLYEGLALEQSESYPSRFCTPMAP